MQIKIFENYEEMSVAAADALLALLAREAAPLLGLATGSTPIAMYQELIRRRDEIENLKYVKTVNLDEYLGLPADHPQSYRYFMQEQLFKCLGLAPGQSHFPHADSLDPKEAEAAAEAYEAQLLELGPQTVQILGLGENGHIGFNEPADVFIPATHVVDLAEGTIQANSRFFASREEVPRQAITMGIAGIMRAREVFLLVSGEKKADALARALYGPISPQLPASILQLHPKLTVFCDRAAAELLNPAQ